MIFTESYTDFGIVFGEIELGSFSSNNSWGFLVDLVDVILKLPLSFRGSKVEGESLSVLDSGQVFSGKPSFVLFVHEIFVVSILLQNTEVEKQFQGHELRDSGSLGSWGNIGDIVVIDEVPPFSLEDLGVLAGLGGGFRSNMLGHNESLASSLDFEISVSPSDLEEPVVGVKTMG